MGLARTCVPLLLVGQLACAVEVSNWPRPPARVDTGVSLQDGTAPTDGAPPALDRSMTSEAAPGACPDLLGSWSGALSGTVKTGLGDYAVTGTISTTLGAVPGAPGDYAIDAGEMTCKVTSMPTMVAKQPLAGEVRCGLLDLTQNLDLFGIQAVGRVRCTFDASGCLGSWTGNSVDGSTQGTGTFELRRQ